MRWDAIVVGAGCAGLAAATRLAERGFRVLVLEQRALLGGRACSFADRESGETLDNGQHLFLGCYLETKTYLRRIGTLHRLRFQERFAAEMLGADGSSGEIAARRLPAPWHLACGMLRYGALGRRERLGLLRVVRAVRRGGRHLSSVTVARWLGDLKQGEASVERFWKPLTLATLNISPERAPANLLAAVLDRGFFAGREAGAPGLASVGLSDLHAEPAARYLSARGGEVRRRAAARRLHFRPDAVEAVELRDGTLERARVVVSAVPPTECRKLAGETRSDLRRYLAPSVELAPSAILSLHVWTERPVLQRPFVGFWGRPFHWAFQKSLLFGDPKVRHLTLVVSAADLSSKRSNEEWRRMAEADLALAAKGKEVRVVRAVAVRESRATWVPPLGGEGARPAPASPVANLFLAGDWTDTGLPATVEGAAASGHAAAALAERVLRGAR